AALHRSAAPLLCLRSLHDALPISTTPPVSLYGSTKLASEFIALEYGGAFGLPVWINRCGVLAGAGQFGTPDQGIFAFWINSYLRSEEHTSELQSRVDLVCRLLLET